MPASVSLREIVEGAGPAAPGVFVVLYVVLTVSLVPVSLLSVDAGALFGPVRAPC